MRNVSLIFRPQGRFDPTGVPESTIGGHRFPTIDAIQMPPGGCGGGLNIRSTRSRTQHQSYSYRSIGKIFCSNSNFWIFFKILFDTKNDFNHSHHHLEYSDLKF